MKHDWKQHIIPIYPHSHNYLFATHQSLQYTELIYPSNHKLKEQRIHDTQNQKLNVIL